MNHRPTLSRAARWSLFLAALLQFGGAAVGPYWHLAGTPPAAAAQSRGGEEPGAPAPGHSELACVVCQTLAGAGVLPPETILPFASVVPVQEAPEAPSVLPRGVRTGARARAPPVV